MGVTRLLRDLGEGMKLLWNMRLVDKFIIFVFNDISFFVVPKKHANF